MGNLRGFSNGHSTPSLIFRYDPNLSSWKHSGTTTNNSLYESWTISQAKNSVKQHHIQNFYVDILTTSITPKFSLAFVNLCKQRNKHFNTYLSSTSIHRETQNNKITLHTSVYKKSVSQTNRAVFETLAFNLLKSTSL